MQGSVTPQQDGGGAVGIYHLAYYPEFNLRCRHVPGFVVEILLSVSVAHHLRERGRGESNLRCNNQTEAFCPFFPLAVNLRQPITLALIWFLWSLAAAVARLKGKFSQRKWGFNRNAGEPVMQFHLDYFIIHTNINIYI